MRNLLFAFLIVTTCLSCDSNKNHSQKVGNISVPEGVVMRLFSMDTPNYLPGNCAVKLIAIPKAKITIIQYVWIENFQQGLKPTVEKLESLPATIFKNVSQEDAARIVDNLTKLGCIAEWKSMTELAEKKE